MALLAPSNGSGPGDVAQVANLVVILWTFAELSEQVPVRDEAGSSCEAFGHPLKRHEALVFPFWYRQDGQILNETHFGPFPQSQKVGAGRLEKRLGAF